MIVSASQLAKESKEILDSVIASGSSALVCRHKRAVAEIRKCPGVSRAELKRRLASVRFSRAEAAELRQAMAAAAEVLGHAGGT